MTPSEIVTLVITQLGALFGAYVSIKVTLAKLEVKVDRCIKDIDGVASVVGTEKSRGRALGEEL